MGFFVPQHCSLAWPVLVTHFTYTLSSLSFTEELQRLKGATSYLVLSTGYLLNKRRSNNGAKLKQLWELSKYADGSKASMPCLAYLYIAGNSIKRLLKPVRQLVSNSEQQEISRHLTIYKQ